LNFSCKVLKERMKDAWLIYSGKALRLFSEGELMAISLQGKGTREVARERAFQPVR
jgi:hypothetical protein